MLITLFDFGNTINTLPEIAPFRRFVRARGPLHPSPASPVCNRVSNACRSEVLGGVTLRARRRAVGKRRPRRPDEVLAVLCGERP